MRNDHPTPSDSEPYDDDPHLNPRQQTSCMAVINSFHDSFVKEVQVKNCKEDYYSRTRKVNTYTISNTMINIYYLSTFIIIRFTGC